MEDYGSRPSPFTDLMLRLKHVFVWLSRATHCRGFGIQSPSDYHFVRYVINEHWPYYAYTILGKDDGWLRGKLGRLYFRLANWRQPAYIVDLTGSASYLQAGCRKAQVVSSAETIELAILPLSNNYAEWFSHCNSSSVVVFEGISRNRQLWQRIIASKQVTISFDLYYCGIVMLDTKRTKQHYIVNF